MGDVDWSTVPLPAVEEEPKKSRPVGTVVFVVLLLLGIPLGLGYVNYVVLNDRVQKIVIADGVDPMIVVQQHGDCFAQNVAIAMPDSFAAFQTPPTTPQLGIATVNYDAYRGCFTEER